MRFKNRISFLLLAFMVIGLFSCLEELEDTDMIAQYKWTPEFAVPIADSEFSIEEFLNAGNKGATFESDTEGLLTIIYHDTLVSQSAGDLYSIPDQLFSKTIVIPDALIPDLTGNGSITHSEEFEFTFNTSSGEEIDSLFLKAGTLITNMDWDFSQPGNFTVTLISMIDNNSQLFTYSKTFDGSAAERQFSSTDDLLGFKLDLVSGGVSNSFKIRFEITLNNNGTALNSGDSFNMDFNFSGLDFRLIYGSLGTRTILSGSDSVSLDFFNNIDNGVFFIEDPKVDFNFNNSYGLPIEVQLDRLRGYSRQNGSLSLSGSVTNPQLISAPGINEVGTSVLMTITADRSNSNIRDLLALLPNLVFYQFDGTINPGGNTENFVLDTSKVDITLGLELPLFGRVSNLSAQKDFEFTGSDLEDLDFALMRVRAVNEFPVDIALQIYFLDDAGNTLDSLITTDPLIVSAAEVDGNGLLLSSTEKITDIEINSNKLDRIKNASSLKLSSNINTVDNGTISTKILDSYVLQISIGVQTEFEINIGG